MANHSYTFPVLFKISENKEFEPIFSAKKLNQYVAKLDPKQKFIWIDKCTKINFVFDYKFTDNFCVAQGNLAGDIEVVNLQKSMVDINTSHMFTNTKIDMKKYYPIRERLLHMAECQKPKKGKVSLTSSEFITSKNVASAIRTNSKNFGLRRGLNLLTVDQDGIFNIQYFDVYASQIEANLFLNKIKSLIKHKKFWAIVSQDAVKKTHLKYKENLSAL